MLRFLLLLLSCSAAFAAEPLSLVVMDPLALPLSCPCVEGYAQRDYDKLGAYLARELGRPVTVTFAETLPNALAKKTCPHVDLVIGKESVARVQGAELKLGFTPLAKLTGKDGKTTMTGLILVRAADSAQTVEDLAGYRILFGPADCDEKFGAPRELLTAAGIELPDPTSCETSAACSDGACKIIEWGDSEHGAAVISSYAAPLLEGCGAVKKGDLRVVGETRPVPFIVAFASNRLSGTEQSAVQRALLAAAEAPEMLTALESLLGFVPLEQEDVASEAPPKTAEPPPAAGADWSGWLGPQRNGHCAWLPRELAQKPKVAWRHPLGRSGLGGIAATSEYVLFGDRDAANQADVFRCLSAKTGEELWVVVYTAPGQLDYDNSPRATPQIVGDRVILYGAFGDLSCVELSSGLVFWQRNIRKIPGIEDQLPWGTCSSPLVAGGLVVVNPGAPEKSLVAIEIATGRGIWHTPGEPQGYGSLNLLTLGGKQQIVGHTQTLLCGWDPETGELLWDYQPPNEGDFNVPTPQQVGDQLLVCTENNSARLFDFNESGRIVPEPVSVCEELAPDMSTPVVANNRVYCVQNQLLVLDAKTLKVVAKVKDSALKDFAPLLIAQDRLLVQGLGGELLLYDISDATPKVVSRQHLFSGEDREADLYTSPAIVGTRLYVRGESEVVAVELGP